MNRQKGNLNLSAIIQTGLNITSDIVTEEDREEKNDGERPYSTGFLQRLEEYFPRRPSRQSRRSVFGKWMSIHHCHHFSFMVADMVACIFFSHCCISISLISSEMRGNVPLIGSAGSASIICLFKSVC